MSDTLTSTTSAAPSHSEWAKFEAEFHKILAFIESKVSHLFHKTEKTVVPVVSSTEVKVVSGTEGALDKLKELAKKL